MNSVTVTERRNWRFWLFGLLVIGGAALMLYSWYSPWWGAQISDLAGRDHIVLRPWGVEIMASEVRTYANKALYAMPDFFEPFMWAYLGVCMLALAISIFITRRINLGRLNLSLAQVLVGLVGLSYVIAVVTAYIIGTIRAGAAKISFVGTSIVFNPMTGGNTRLISALKDGYWLALAAGLVLVALALLRPVIVGRLKNR